MTRAAAIRRVAAALPGAVAPLMRSHGRCIAATKIGIDALAQFGIAAAPLAVDARVCNPAAAAWLDAGAVGGQAAFDACGGYTLSSFETDGPTRPATRAHVGRQWSGHLIAHIPDPGLVVDFDARQFARPERAIVVPDALVLPWPADARDALARLRSGVVVYYRARLDAFGRPDAGWTDAPDWQKDTRDAVARVLRAARR